MGRLIHNGKVSGAEMWCLDHDRKVLEQAGTANTVIVRKEEPHMVRFCNFLPSERTEDRKGTGEKGNGHGGRGGRGVSRLFSSMDQISDGWPGSTLEEGVGGERKACSSRGGHKGGATQGH